MTELHVVFDGPPGPESGRFVELETKYGTGWGRAKWRQRGKFWVLVLTPEDFPTEDEEREEALKVGPFGVGA